MGPTTAKVPIVVFADFECPFCQVLATQTLKWIRGRYPKEIAVIYRHWPLKSHRFAYPTARAAECASEQGRFEPMHDALYAQQDSFGLKAFEAFAIEAGVTDTISFAACMRRPGAVAAIEKDWAAAKELETRGTPTIVMNGLVIAGAIDTLQLDQLVRDALKQGRSP
jgi:protein-disulfide isomerase